MSASDNNKRIAKNTLMLYFRMIFLMLVSLYTSRVVLNALGVEDYGIYNVVGGVVAMFSILSGSLSSAISRFITFELGRGDIDKLKKVFSASVTIQMLLSAIIVVLIEIIGVWFLNNKMVIPPERIYAANWVLQLSVVTFVVNLISIPYNAAIVAHEHMSAFAYISILEAVGKLLVAFLITRSPIDKLIFYAILLTVIAVLIRMVYGWYCNKKFIECHYHFRWDKSLLKEMFGFAGWNYIGNSSVLLRDQGGNIIINLFFGPAVNAARGVAVQVQHTITGFVTNFMTALNPQITKSYASGNHKYMMTLIFQGARLSFYMLLILSLPVLLDTHYILVLWLKLIPEHTVPFIRLSLLFSLLDSISYPMITAMLATGRIRNYQIIVGGSNMMNLPLSYFFLYLGYAPETVFIIAIVISQICLAARLYMLRGMINLRVRDFIKKVYLNVLFVGTISSVVPWYISVILDDSLFNFIFLCLISILFTSTTIYFVGCNRGEREKVKTYILNFKKKVFK